MKSRNFTLEEIAHRPLPANLQDIGLMAMGYMQAIRDLSSARFGKDVPLKITSGYRELTYNREVSSSKTPDNSYHVWRWQGDKAPLWAVDFAPIGVPLAEYFAWYKDITRGERYMHRGNGFIHTAPFAPDKKPWVV